MIFGFPFETLFRERRGAVRAPFSGPNWPKLGPERLQKGKTKTKSLNMSPVSFADPKNTENRPPEKKTKPSLHL